MAITRLGPNQDITAAKIAGTINFKNLIINGDMSLAQRGTSATGLGNGDSGYQTVDRWRFSENGAPTCEFTQSQDTDVPSGQGFATSLKMDCTTAQGSLASGDAIRITQRVEGQNLQYLKKGTANAESLTFSFWVKSNKTGIYVVELFDADNTRSFSKAYTIDSASTWEKKTLTFSGDTTGAFDNDNQRSLDVRFWLVAGTDFTSGTLPTSWESRVTANEAVGQVNLADNTANNFWITGVQLEADTSASDFEFLPYDVNLRRCMRYFFNHYTPNDNGLYGLFTAHTPSAGRLPYRFIVPMRDAPSTSFSTAGGFTWLGNNTSGNPTTMASESLNKYSCTINVGGSFSQGYSYWLAGSTSTEAKFDAEL